MAEDKKTKKQVKRPTAEKRLIQNQKRRIENRSQKAEIRTAIRRFEEAVTAKDPAKTQEKLKDVYSLVDKAVKKGLLKRNNAARTKSRLTAKAARA